jgi:hypothetical protein
MMMMMNWRQGQIRTNYIFVGNYETSIGVAVKWTDEIIKKLPLPDIPTAIPKQLGGHWLLVASNTLYRFVAIQHNVSMFYIGTSQYVHIFMM